MRFENINCNLPFITEVHEITAAFKRQKEKLVVIILTIFLEAYHSILDILHSLSKICFRRLVYSYKKWI